MEKLQRAAPLVFDHAGIDEYITKPVDRNNLLTAMTRLIKRVKNTQ